MNRKVSADLLLIFFLSFIFCFVAPRTIDASPQGMQLALKGVSADDAEAAKSDDSKKVQSETKENQAKESINNAEPAAKAPQVSEVSQNTPTEIKEQNQDSSTKSIEQEIKELKQEIKKLRGENEARKKLEAPEEQKSESVEDILSAAGRQYSLLKKNTVGLSYSFGYSYYSGDVIDESTVVLRRVNHNITNTISLEYALFNNLTLSSSIPFVYKYNKVGTDESMDVTDLGDISLGIAWQPFKAGGRIPTTIFTLGASLKTGTSPYEINYDDELSTGAGYYGISAGVSLSKVVDPLVAFGNLSVNYGFPESGLSQIIYQNETNPSERIYLTEVKPGTNIGLAFGFGYALSYQASMNLSAQFAYSFGSKYTNKGSGSASTESETGSSVSSSLNIGTGWRITPARSIYASVGMGLTNNDPDVSLNLKFPFEF